MNWEIKSNRLTKSFKLNSFDEIIMKLMLVAQLADEQEHHPDFAVENYNEITFFLWTHSEHAVTAKDHELAKGLDEIFDGSTE